MRPALTNQLEREELEKKYEQAKEADKKVHAIENQPVHVNFERVEWSGVWETFKSWITNSSMTIVFNPSNIDY